MELNGKKGSELDVEIIYFIFDYQHQKLKNNRRMVGVTLSSWYINNLQSV